VDALGRHLARQREERLLLGLGWGDHGLVFPNIVGKPLHPSNFLQRSFYPLERAGLPRIRFHDLHHSAATLLLGLGIHPKLVSEMPGHSQVGITLDLYSHVTATMQQEAVRAFEGLFGSQVGSREGATEQ
jgi:integrase